MNNSKAIGFMLSQFKGMVLAFGKSEETLMMFINQVEQMYNIHQISDDDKKTVYKVLHINRGKRNKDNINFKTYEMQDVLNSVHRILVQMHKAKGIEQSKNLARYLEEEFESKNITKDELGYLFRIYNISKSNSSSKPTKISQSTKTTYNTWDSCSQSRGRRAYSGC